MRAAQTAWLLSALPARRRLESALRDPRAAQLAVLERLLAGAADCAFGREHGLSKVRTVEDFRAAVPVRGYEALAPWIERAKDGEARVLAGEPVLMFEKTSGSSSAAKYIPYTRSLKAEFEEAISAWIADLYIARPKLRAGRGYWCVTPAARRAERTRGGLPVGFESDSEYLGSFARLIARTALCSPAEAARADDLETGLYITLRELLRAEDLAFVSIWNPSFLEVLLSALARNKDRLLEDLARVDPRRAARLRAGGLSPAEIWPNLALVSCWGDGAARAQLPALREALPGVEIQPKGLLATEGVVTVPRLGLPGALPALNSHFLEFVEEGGGRVGLADELEPGGRYGVVVTTGGGLWRYDLGDVVRVAGFHGRAPLLEFEGRRDDTCDLAGEKLHAGFVAGALEALRREGAWSGPFAMLAPASGRRGYALFVEGSASEDLAGRLDRRLRENPHYDYARSLGQLGAVETLVVSGAREGFVRRCESLGQRAGGVKPAALDKRDGWEPWLR